MPCLQVGDTRYQVSWESLGDEDFMRRWRKLVEKHTERNAPPHPSSKETPSEN